MLFFFKQKTAYEIRLCDWSSDVCSSDLFAGAAGGFAPLVDRASSRRWMAAWSALALGLWITAAAAGPFVAPAWRAWSASRAFRPALDAVDRGAWDEADRLAGAAAGLDPRSEERRVGKECRALCRYRWSPYH